MALPTPGSSRPGEPARGRLITFEGGEGAGKSTQIERLALALRSSGSDVLITREPGGTPGAEAIRRLLVEGASDRWAPVTEILLHTAARHDHVERTIRPALAAGRLVLCDRFVDSTRVYQGIAGGAGLDLVDRLHSLTFGDLESDLTLILDVPVETGLARRHKARDAGRYERMGVDFHTRVRQGFLDLGRRAPERCVVIDAAREIDAVARAVADTVGARLGIALSGLA